MKLTKKIGRRVAMGAAALAVVGGTAVTGATAYGAEDATGAAESAQAVSSASASKGGDEAGDGATPRSTLVTARSDIGPVPYFVDWSTWSQAGTFPPGETFYGACWTEGQFISDHGVAHDRWVQFASGGRNYYVWGGVLVGNETGGVPNHC